MALKQCILATCLYICIQFTKTDSYKLESRHRRQDTATSPSTTADFMTTSNTTVTVTEFAGSDPTRIGVIVGVICGIIALIAAMAIIATIWIRNKRSRDAEYERAAKVQLSSTQSAGVYNDLTTSPIVKKPVDTLESTEMDKLKNEDEEV